MQMNGIIAKLTGVHDEAPASEKRRWGDLIAKAEDSAVYGSADIAALAADILEAARARVAATVDAVVRATGTDREDAERAVGDTRIGALLSELTGLAEDALRRAEQIGDVGKAADELDRLARERASRTGEPFFESYERVCGDEPELTKRAVCGETVDPREADLTMDDFLFDRAVRSSEMTKTVEAGLNARAAERELMRRAREIQVERASERLHLIAAIDIAKAERPALARAAKV